MKRTFIASAAVAVVVASAVHAQEPAAAGSPGDQVATRAAVVAEMVTAGDEAARRNVPGNRPFQTTFGTGGEDHIAAYFIAAHTEREGYKALVTLMEARADKQVGATPGSSGSTSLAMKGLVPDILGIAVENGALNREVSGTTVTFRTKPMGIIKSLQGRGLLDTYSDYSTHDAARFASRFSASASFDTSRGPSAGTLTAGDQQLTTWSVRYEVFNGRNPAAAHYVGLWKALARNSTAYLAAANAVDAALNGWAEFRKWQDDLTSDVDTNVDSPWAANKNTGAAAARFKTILEAALPKLESLPNQPDAVTKAIDDYVAQLTIVQKGIDKIYEFAGTGPLLTFDWTTARDAQLPDLYTATGILEAALGASRKTDLTLNVAASFYRSRPEAASRAFKSFDVTAQLEHPLGGAFLLPLATVAISGRYSHLPNDTLVPTTATSGGDQSAGAMTALAPKGNIGIVQAKLTVPIKGSGIKVPLSITASNRTELIKEMDVRASFGITFDLDTFVAALSARGTQP
jgi:hypothetical protein